MKPALHRSLTFWSGLLIVIFTCWAWRDSSTHVSGFTWKHLGASSVTRGIVISHLSTISGPLRGSRQALPSYPASWPHEFLPAPFLVRSRDTGRPDPNYVPTSLRDSMQFSADFYGPRSWVLYLPYWIILLAILIPWTALLLWRARRRKRASLSELP